MYSNKVSDVVETLRKIARIAERVPGSLEMVMAAPDVVSHLRSGLGISDHATLWRVPIVEDLMVKEGHAILYRQGMDPELVRVL